MPSQPTGRAATSQADSQPLRTAFRGAMMASAQSDWERV